MYWLWEGKMVKPFCRAVRQWEKLKRWVYSKEVNKDVHKEIAMKMLLVTSFRWKYRKIEPLEGIGWISLCVAFVQSKYETVKNDVYILPGICFRIFQLNPKTEKEAEECDTIDVPTVDPVKLGDEYGALLTLLFLVSLQLCMTKRLCFRVFPSWVILSHLSFAYHP